MDETSARRLRMLRLQAAVAVGDLFAALLQRSSSYVSPPHAINGKGISIIIPERGNAPLLQDCLSSVEAAIQCLSEPAEILVVVNGSLPAEYDNLARRYPAVRWIFSAQPLGFSAAVRKGLAKARFDWVYLLNNDVVLEKEALGEVLHWRGSGIFAIASQIFIEPETSRRVETGWTDCHVNEGIVEIIDVLPEEGSMVRGSLYAGGGASLFQRRLLEQLIGSRDPYYPFYWEDVEWGVRARKMGYTILFCPSSKVHHRRRATINRFFPEGEVDRIFRRNGWLFQLRNLKTIGSMERLWARLTDIDPGTFRELTSWRKAIGIFLARIRSAREPFGDLSLEYTRDSYHSVPQSELHQRPLIVVASPYALFPPTHGGAVRLDRLLDTVSREFDVVLLSDEAEGYSSRSIPYFGRFAEIHLIGRRSESQSSDRISRIESHSRPMMKERLASLVWSLRPDLIQIEFSELAALAAVRRGTTPWIIALHEVDFSQGALGREDRYEMSWLSRYDGVIVCSPEDKSLVPIEKTWLIPNGVDVGIPYTSSAGNRSILFAGPFRYRPNFEGIQAFLELVYPRLLPRIPGLTLHILGGPEARDLTRDVAAFRQRGVIIYNNYQDPRPFLERAAITINPLSGMRGSSIKLLESITAGRVVVSTRNGARGFQQEAFASLIVVEDVIDFYDPIERLLLDETYRIRLEKPVGELLAKHSWKRAADALLGVYRDCMK
jgi:GT2 family glycosyltransferase